MLSGPFLYSNRMPGVPHPVMDPVEVFSSMNLSRPDSKARPVNSSVVSGPAMTDSTFHDCWRSNKQNLKWDTWRASAMVRDVTGRCVRVRSDRPARLVSARRAVS
jgi:hypothetical protein